MRRSIYWPKQRNADGSGRGDAFAGGPVADDDDALLMSEGADLGMLFSALRAHIPLIGLIILVGAAFGVFFALAQETVYTAEARVRLDPRDIQVTEVADVVTDRPVNETMLDTEVEVLRSAKLLDRVIDELDLLQDPEFNGALKEEEKGFFGKLLSGADAADEDSGEEKSQAALRVDVRDILNGSMRISRVGLTAVIAIRCDSTNPETAQAVCNSLAKNYVAAQLEGKVAATEVADTFLEERVAELREELQRQEQAIEEFRVRNPMVGPNVTADQQLLGELNSQLALQKLEVAEKQARLSQARRLVSGKEPGGTQTLAEVLGSTTIGQLREQQAQVIRTRADLATRYRETHPEMIKVNQEAAGIEAQIQAEVSRILSNLGNEVIVVKERVRALDRNIEEVEERMKSSAEIVARLREMEQDAQATRNVYLETLSRAKGIQDSGNIQTPDSEMLSEADLPSEPSRPNRKMIVAIAIVLSGLLGAGAAVVLDLTDQRLRTPEAARRVSGLPHLGSVPIVTARKYKGRPHRDLLDRGTSVFSEAFEELFTRVQSLSTSRPPRTVLFTSAAAAEGKTTSALCFALAAARSGKRVVLLEGDLRCPTIYDVVAIQGIQVEDLKAVLDGDLEWEEVAWTEPQTGLRILPVKSPSDDPIAHLSSHKLEELLEDLRAEFDMVVIDTAPVVPVSDALKLMPYADKVVFVMRWRTATKQDVEAALRKIRDVGGDVAGFMLTFVNQSQRWRFGAGGLPSVSGRNRRYYGRG